YLPHPGPARFCITRSNPHVQQRGGVQGQEHPARRVPAAARVRAGRAVPGGPELMASVSSKSAVLVGLAVLGALGALVTGSTSCASPPDSKRFTEIVQPDFPTYRDF